MLKLNTNLYAPAAGLIGGLIAGGGTAAGLATGAGMMGMAVGNIAGSMLGGSGGSGGGRISAPTNRSYLGEMQDALNSQASIQDQLLGFERQYTPQYQSLQEQSLMGQMGSLQNLYGQAIPQSMALQSQYAQAQAPLYGQVGELSRNAYQQALDPNTRGLAAMMQQSAMSDLYNGRNLTPEMTQQAQQSARAAMAARGLTGNQAIGQEVLNSYNLQNQREDRARIYAGGVYNAGVAQQQAANSMYGAPLMANMNLISPSGMLGQAQQNYGNLGAKLFQPESQYNAGIYGANQSNQMQTQLGNAQIAAGQQSGLMSMVGQLGGAYLGNAGLFGGTKTAANTGNYNAQTGGLWGAGGVI